MCDLPRLLFEVSALTEPFALAFVACAGVVLLAVPIRLLLGVFR